jgi:hypothetical protein
MRRLPLIIGALWLLCATADHAPGRASYALGGSRARQLCGLDLRDDQTLDPWTGYRIDTTAAPTARAEFDSLKTRTLAQMESGAGIADAAERSCARLTARLLSTHHPEIRLDDTGGADASYDPRGHIIRISDSPDKAYLLTETNLRKKLIHETLHLAQAIPEGRNPTVDASAGERRPAECLTIHAYEQRAAILDRLRPYFPMAAACALPEVPMGCRNSVPDCVGSSRGSAERSMFDITGSRQRPSMDPDASAPLMPNERLRAMGSLTPPLQRPDAD